MSVKAHVIVDVPERIESLFVCATMTSRVPCHTSIHLLQEPYLRNCSVPHPSIRLHFLIPPNVSHPSNNSNLTWIIASARNMSSWPSFG